MGLNINPIVRGSNFPELQWEENDFDPVRGYIYRAEFKGLSGARAQSLQQYYADNKIACRLRLQGDVTILSVEDATQQFTLDTWQMPGNQESFDGLSHPIVTAICTDDQIGAIRALIQEINTQQLTATSTTQLISNILTNPLFNSISGASKAIMAVFIGLQFRGSTDFYIGQYVLRHETNVSNTWQANISDVNVNSVYTPAELLTEVQSTALWINPLPARLAYKISHIPTPATIPANYQWGWLKSVSTEGNAANNRISIATEYTLNLWSVQPSGYYATF